MNRTSSSASKSHPLTAILPPAVAFNVLNGYLMGSWLGGRTSPLTAAHGAVPEFALHTGLFWLGVLTWFAGFVGNLVSDEILYNLRRPSKDGKPKPRYSVPRGFLYDVPFGGISFPAYLCEWAEWLGYAVAACCYSIAPALPLSPMSTSGTEALEQATQIFASDPARATCQLFRLSTYATPPFLFFYAEVASESRVRVRPERVVAYHGLRSERSSCTHRDPVTPPPPVLYHPQPCCFELSKVTSGIRGNSSRTFQPRGRRSFQVSSRADSHTEGGTSPFSVLSVLVPCRRCPSIEWHCNNRPLHQDLGTRSSFIIPLDHLYLPGSETQGDVRMTCTGSENLDVMDWNLALSCTIPLYSTPSRHPNCFLQARVWTAKSVN